MYFLNIFLRSFLVLPLLLTHCRCWFIVAPDHLNDTHTHTHTVRLLWTRDQPDVENSTWHHTTLTRDRYPCTRRDPNPQTQQASGRGSTP